MSLFGFQDVLEDECGHNDAIAYLSKEEFPFPLEKSETIFYLNPFGKSEDKALQVLTDKTFSDILCAVAVAMNLNLSTSQRLWHDVEPTYVEVLLPKIKDLLQPVFATGNFDIGVQMNLLSRIACIIIDGLEASGYYGTHKIADVMTALHLECANFG